MMQVLMTGAVFGKSEIRGKWTKRELELRINAVELIGAKLGLFSFFKDNRGIKPILVLMNSNIAVAFINNMGELSRIFATILLLTHGNRL